MSPIPVVHTLGMGDIGFALSSKQKLVKTTFLQNILIYLTQYIPICYTLT